MSVAKFSSSGNEEPPPDDPRSLRSSVVEVLAGTANGCLAELGYFPGMPQRLQQLERQNAEWQSDIVKLLEDNKALTRALQERNDATSSESTIHSLKNQIQGLLQDMTRLKKQNDALLAGQPSVFHQLYSDHHKLKDQYNEARHEINVLRHHIALLDVKLQGQATAIPRPNASPTVISPSATYSGPSPLVLQNSQSRMPMVHSQNTFTHTWDSPYPQNPPIVASLNQQEGMRALANHAPIQNQAISSNFTRRSSSAFATGRPSVLQLDSNPPVLSDRAPRAAKKYPHPPHPPHPAPPPRLSVDTRITPVLQLTKQQPPLSANARLQSHVASSNSPFETLNNAQKHPTSFIPFMSSAVTHSSEVPRSYGMYPPNLRSASLPHLTTNQQSPSIDLRQKLGSPVNVVPQTDGAGQDQGLKRGSPGFSYSTNLAEPLTGTTENTLVSATSTTQPLSPALLRESLKRAPSRALVAGDVTSKKLRLSNEGQKDDRAEKPQEADCGVSTYSKDHDGSDDGDIEVGPDGLRLVEDCLADIIEDDANNGEIKTCRLCIVRFKRGYYHEEPKPFERPTTEELVQHCSSEHHDAWETLRHAI